MAQTPARRLALRLVAHARGLMAQSRAPWADAMESELHAIDSDWRALRWAAGCLAAGFAARARGPRRWSLWRLAPWTVAASLLLLPLVAMQFTTEVQWSATDFLIMGTLLFCVCAAFELAARRTGNIAYRAAVAIAVVAAFLLVWITLAVGVIGGGTQDARANLLFGGVLAIGIAGAVIARFRPRGMSRALVAMAVAQCLVAAVALALGDIKGTLLTLLFAGLWLVSAWFFVRAAQAQTRLVRQR